VKREAEKEWDKDGDDHSRTHFTFRVDTWTPDRESIVEHVAGLWFASDWFEAPNRTSNDL
jgi:hypothetical protein